MFLYICTVNRISTIILLLAFLGQTFSQGVYYLGYMVDKREYEKNCVNKARPMLHCNGKCQLMKKMMEAEKKNQQAPELKLVKSDGFTTQSSFYMAVPAVALPLTRFLIPTEQGAPVDQASSIFHPPLC